MELGLKSIRWLCFDWSKNKAARQISQTPVFRPDFDVTKKYCYWCYMKTRWQEIHCSMLTHLIQSGKCTFKIYNQSSIWPTQSITKICTFEYMITKCSILPPSDQEIWKGQHYLPLEKVNHLTIQVHTGDQANKSRLRKVTILREN